MIGLSPLGTSHPDLFQQVWVRTSSWCYPTFILLMPRSSGFGSDPTNSCALLRLAFAAPPPTGLSSHVNHKSLTHNTKGTVSALRPPPVCKHSVSGTLSLPSSGCFSPFPHGTGSLSVTEEYLGLEGGPPMFRQDCTCPALLVSNHAFYLYGAITRYGPTFQKVLLMSPVTLASSPFARHY